MGTIAPEMGADKNSSTLGTVLFGKTRRLVLALTFGKPEEAFYVRQVARYAATGNGVVQRELEQLASCGILTRRVSGRQVYFQANSGCPIFQELRALVVKTAGVSDVVREALAPIAGRVSMALIYGSFAAGRQGERSDVDVLVVGEVAFAEVVESLASAQERIGRDVNPTVYSPADFRSRLAARHHFLDRVLKEPKVFLIGDAHELERLASERMAGRAHSKR
jgi:uncharacterized protein